MEEINGKKFELEGKLLENGECIKSMDGEAKLCSVDGKIKFKKTEIE